MKNLFLILFGLTSMVGQMLFGSFVHAAGTVFTPKRFEAEHGVYQDFTLVSDASASNGQYLKISSSGLVRWSVHMDHAGWYLFTFRYRAPSEQVNYFKKTDRTSQIGFGYATSWSFNEWRAKLNAGENIVELSPNWGNGMDLDYIEIDSVDFTPTMTPVNNTFYQFYPRDIVLKLNTYGHRLLSITAGELPLEYSVNEYPHQEDAYWVTIKKTGLINLSQGLHQVMIHLDDQPSLTMNLTVMPNRIPAPLTIIVPDISHGAAVFIILPTGKTLLVDCGKASERDQTLIPLLQRNNVDKIDYFILTHYHEDHDSEDGGEKIKTLFNVDHFYDNTTVKKGETLEIERTKIKILNAGIPSAGSDLNPTSVAFRLEYKGFVYHHGGDCYASQQTSMLNAYPGEIPSHVFHANHHFHGSSDVTFMRTMDPYLVLVQADQAIYARSTYMMVFKKQTAEWLKTNNKRFIEDTPCLEVGMVVIRAYDANHWSYETYFENENTFIPYIHHTMAVEEDRNSPPIFVQKPDSCVTVAANTVELEFVTDKRAFLRYSEIDQPYDEMPHTFETGEGSFYHTVTLKGQHNERKKIYIRMRDVFGNTLNHSEDMEVLFDLSLSPIYWYDLDYPDYDWKEGQGPIGYGNTTDKTTCNIVKTLYLRKSFELADSVKAFGVLLQGHDGMVAYLNGRQIASLNLSTPSPTYDDYATNAPASPITKVVVLDAETLAQLRIGRNVLAVEVHQADVSNPTISADARVFNNLKIFADLKGVWKYYDEGKAPPTLTYRDIMTMVPSAKKELPDEFTVSNNFPNPFNAETCFEVSVPKDGTLEASVYNLRGEKIATLFHGRISCGCQKLFWRVVESPSGVYFVKFTLDTVTNIAKVLLLK